MKAEIKKIRLIKTDKTSTLAILLVITLLMSICPIAPLKVDAAATFGTNLIANGNGEFGASLLKSHGWTEDGTSNWYGYTSIGGVTPHGGSYIMGIYSSSINFAYTRTIYQDVDVTALSTQIAANSVVANFSGWIQRTGQATGDVTVQMQAVDSSGNPFGVIDEVKYGSTTGWKNATITEAVAPGTSKIRITLNANEICNGIGAFDDLSLILSSNTALPPTIDTIPEQVMVSGGSVGPIAFTVGDADSDVNSLVVTATSSNQTVIPDGNISTGGSGTNRNLTLTAAAGQTGNATITVGVSDGVKKTYSYFAVTVNPDAQIGSELVTNGTGASIAGWTGETSRYNVGSAFVVGTIPGGSSSSDIYQDINIGKFGAVVDTELLQYNASATVSGGGFFRFEGLNEYNTVIWSKGSSQVNTTLPAGTRIIRVTVGGPVNGSIKNISFKVSNSNLPAISAVVDREIIAGTSTTINYTVAYEGSSVTPSVVSDNQTVIPNGNISLGGSGYQKSITATSVAGVSGIAKLTITVGAKTRVFNIIVKSVPGAPTDVTAVGGDGCATVSFNAPANTGGSTISQYEVISNPGNITATGTTSPILISGLTNGETYTFTVKATNETGTSNSSAASSAILLLSEPGAPTGISATPLNEKAEVSFNAPSSDGGSAIIGYTVSSYPEGLSVTGTSSPLTVSGLTNGVSYTFKVSATNGKGTGTESVASNPVTPRTIPDKPTGVTAVAGNASAMISFTAPGSDGGSAITEYTVTSSPENIIKVGTGSPINITGLTNGTDYTFTVTATNAAGTGVASDASTTVTPMTTPGKPTGVSAIAGNESASVSFNTPVSDGGSTITSYTVTAYPGGKTASGTTSPISITGLTNGTNYTFTVVAVNKVGVSGDSDPSTSVKPITVPGKPMSVVATPGNGVASIAFLAPSSDGGSAIVGYTVTSSPGGVTAYGTSSPLTITGLNNGTNYTFTVVATNAAGTGEDSDASESVMPDTPNYTVTYNMNGGSGTAPVETTKKENGTFNTKNSAITPPTGMQFKEWNTMISGLGTSYKAGETVTVGTENIILYAIWEIIPKVTSVNVTPINTLLEKGEKQQLVVSVTVEGTAVDEVNWTTSDSSGKVTVDNAGLVTVSLDAAAAEYTITATSFFDNSKKCTAIIRVAPSLVPYNNVLGAVKETDYFSESWATYQSVLASNIVTNANTQLEVDNAIKAIDAAQKNLVSYPLAKDIKEANVLIIGQYAFVLGDETYTLSNFTKAEGTKYLNPTTAKNEIYYFAGGKWYDLVKNEGKGLVDPIDPSLINGNGKYMYWNMVEKRP